ncbi:MAG: Ig-like domain-containing protein [Candidatus Dormibacteria bacterium]
MMRAVSSMSMLRAFAGLGLLSVGLSGCTTTTTARAGSAAQQAHAIPPTQATKVTGSGAAAPAISITPADRAGGVPLDTSISVTSRGGTLSSVTVTSGDRPIGQGGVLNKGHDQWIQSGGLDSDMTYAVRAVATATNGSSTTALTSFHTLAAQKLTSDTSPGDGEDVGVGMPVKIHFNTDIPNDKRQGIIDHIAVKSAPPQNGGWYWPAANELHYRPQHYWISGSSVSVQALLQGVDAGNRFWGLDNWTLAFHIADKHVAIIDTAAHNMKVYNNDRLVDTWPVSTGRPNRQTINGKLVIWGKTSKIRMDSRTLGIPIGSPDGYLEDVYWDTAISTDGFYVHSAPWSVWAQGSSNVSHGCVNLSPDHAITFYNTSIPGDVVEVINSDRPASFDDGEGDWQTDFSQLAQGGHAVNGAGGSAPSQAPIRTS